MFNSYIFILPEVTRCDWIGLANIGSSSITENYVFVRTCFLPDVYLHELGHNLGFSHSGTEGNGYGDETSVMGNVWSVHPEKIYNYGPEHLVQVNAIPSTRVLDGQRIASSSREAGEKVVITGRLASLHLLETELPADAYQYVRLSAASAESYGFSFNGYDNAPMKDKVSIILGSAQSTTEFIGTLRPNEVFYSNTESFRVSEMDENGFIPFVYTNRPSTSAEDSVHANVANVVVDGVDETPEHVHVIYFENGVALDNSISLPSTVNSVDFSLTIKNDDVLNALQKTLVLGYESDDTNLKVTFSPEYISLLPQTQCHASVHITFNDEAKKQDASKVVISTNDKFASKTFVFI